MTRTAFGLDRRARLVLALGSQRTRRSASDPRGFCGRSGCAQFVLEDSLHWVPFDGMYVIQIPRLRVRISCAAT